MKKSRIVCFLSVVLACGMLFSGCGGGAKDSKPTQTGSESGSGAAQSTEKPAAETGEEITLTYYSFSDWSASEPFEGAYQQAVEQFEKENPGYKIELQSDPWGDWEQKYKTMFASGNPADIFIVNNPEFPSFANSGNLLDMDEYLDGSYFEGFFPGVQSMYRWQDKNMGIAFTTDCRVLWYNKEIFEQAGLDPEKPPTTWKELSEAAKTIFDKTGKYGFGMDLGLKQFPAESLYCSSDSQIINVADDGAVTPNVDTPEFKGYLQTLVDMKDSYEPDYATLNHHDVGNLFAEGQIGMIIGNVLAETDIYDKDWYGQALVPRMDDSSPYGSFGGGFGICVSSQTKAPEQAVKFAQILCSPEFNARLVSDMPASEAGLANSEYTTDAKYTVFMEEIQYARQAQPKTLFYAEIDSAVNDTVAEVLLGGKEIDEAVNELTQKIEEIVAG